MQILIKAEGNIFERWDVIKSWLLENHPSLVSGFSKPAKEKEILKVESELNCTFPKDFRDFVGIHNDQIDNTQPMVWTCSLLPIEKIPAVKEWLTVLFADNDGTIMVDVNCAIRPIVFSEKWIPIGVSGRDYLCLDLDPTSHGQYGQVILIACDSDEHLLVASSFAEFLSLYFQEIQTGEIELES